MEVERTSVVQDRGWELAEASVSPRGGWVVVTATATAGQPGVRVFVVDLDTFFVSEATPTDDVRAQLFSNSKPGMVAAEWAPDERALRFPAATVYPSTLNPASYHSGTPVYERAVAVGSKAWLEVRSSPSGSWTVELDDSPQALERSSPKPDSIDQRLGIRWRGKGSFELIDTERGGAAITRFSGMTWYHLVTAVIDPTGDWIGVTVNREAFFSHGRRGLVLERTTGRHLVLADDIVGRLHFRPNHRDVLGISRSRLGGGELVIWRLR